MKITIQTANGNSIELDVTEEVGTFFLSSLEAEEKNDRRNTRRHTSLSTFTYEDGRFFDSGIDIGCQLAERDVLRCVLERLSVRQQSLLLAHYHEGRTYTEIAKAEGKYPSTIMRETDKAADAFRRMYKEFQ